MELEDTKFNIFPWIKQARHNGAEELSVKSNFDFIWIGCLSNGDGNDDDDDDDDGGGDGMLGSKV